MLNCLKFTIFVLIIFASTGYSSQKLRPSDKTIMEDENAKICGMAVFDVIQSRLAETNSYEKFEKFDFTAYGWISARLIRELEDFTQNEPSDVNSVSISMELMLVDRNGIMFITKIRGEPSDILTLYTRLEPTITGRESVTATAIFIKKEKGFPSVLKVNEVKITKIQSKILRKS